jgi:hypothetical protein
MAGKSLAAQRAEYQLLADNIALLETSYFEETAGVEDTLLPLGRVMQTNKRKAQAVRREQRVFSLSSSGGGAWPEAAHGAQALVTSLLEGMAPAAQRARRRAAAAQAREEREEAEAKRAKHKRR